MGKDDWKIAFKEAFKAADDAEKEAEAAKNAATLAKEAAAKAQTTHQGTITAAQDELRKLTANPKINPKKQIKAATESRDTATTALGVAKQTEIDQAQAETEAQGELTTAQTAKSRAVLAARTDYGRARRRLVELVKKIPAGADTTEMDRLYKELETEYQADDFDIDKLYAKLEAVETEVEKLTATDEAPLLFKQLKQRLEAFAGHVMFDAQELVALRKDLKSADALVKAARFEAAMKLMRSDMEFALGSFETDAQDLVLTRKQLEGELDVLEADPMRDAAAIATIRTEIKQKVEKAKKGSVADGTEALGELAGEVDAARVKAAENATAATGYPAELVKVKQEATAFEQANPSYAQECRQKVRVACIASAEAVATAPAGTTDFVHAMDLLEDARSTLVGLQAKVDAKKAAKNAADQDKAEAAALKKAQDKGAADKAAKEEADRKALVPGSLAKIGKAKMSDWLTQLERLLHEAKPSPVKLVVSGAQSLKKFDGAIFTVEVYCAIQTTTSAPVDNFVVHYHPTLTKKEVAKNTNSSRFHVKRGRSVPPIFKIDEDGHWLISKNHVPHVNTVPDS